MKYLFKYSIVLITIIIVCTACNISKATFSDADKWVPSDFDMNKGTVLIETYPGKEKWNESMIAFVTENYRGKFIIVDKKEIDAKTGKYSDLAKYRFAFRWNTSSSWRVSATSTSGTTQTDWYGRIYDRNADKLYPATKKSNNYGWKGYIPFINSVVKFSEKTNKPSSLAVK